MHMSCVTLNWPLLGALLALAAPRTVAEAISRYHSLQMADMGWRSTSSSSSGDGESESETE